MMSACLTGLTGVTVLTTLIGLTGVTCLTGLTGLLCESVSTNLQLQWGTWSVTEDWVCLCVITR